MARPRHAMRVHPLRSKGVVVGVPVAAAVAFGAHSVLGVTPLADQQDVPAAATAAPSAAPLQSYGLAIAPPPTTLDLLSAPGDQVPAGSTGPAGAASSGTATSSGTTASSKGATTTTPIVADRAAAAPTRTEPIAAPAPVAAAPAPSMMTFSGGDEQPQARSAAPSAPAAPQQQAAPQQSESADDGDQRSGGGSLLGLDLGVAKVSVLSFGE